MVHFSTIVNCYESSGHHLPPLYKDVSIAIGKVNNLRNAINYREKLIEKLDGDFSEESLGRFRSAMKSELSSTRISFGDMKITTKNSPKIFCLYNIKHARFFCYEKEYACNRNWIPCGWADKDKQHVIEHGLEKARDAYMKKIQKEIETKRGELGFADAQLVTALHAAIDNDGDNGQNKAA